MAVSVTVGSTVLGQTQVVPYSHREGLQYVAVRGVPTDQPLVYKVPYYDVTIQGGSSYTAVRFGLQNKGTAPKTRTCDAGLSSHRVCTPTWLPKYSPHSFNGTSRDGAWILIPGKSFLIHEGADTRIGQVGGSLGCIEILDGKWNSFLAEIEKLAKTTVTEIGKKGLLSVTIKAAPYPTATLVS